MTDVTPPVTTVVPTAAIVPTAATEPILLPTTLQSVPDRIEQLARQIQLSGTVTDLQSNGDITLRTTIGDLVLALPQTDATGATLTEQLTAALQSQKQLNIVVQPGNPPTQAVILLPQNQAAVSPVQLLPQTNAQAMADAIKQTVPLTIGATIAAIVLPAAVSAQFVTTPVNLAVPPSTPINSPSVLAVVGNGIASDSQNTQMQTATDQSKQFTGSGTPNAPSAIPVPNEIAENLAAKAALPNAIQPEANPQLQPGTTVGLKVANIIPPGGPVPVLTAPDQIVATVVGKGPNGQLLVSTGDATMFIRQNVDLPLGSRLILNLLPPSPNANLIVANSAEHELGGLQKLFAALQELDPQAAQQLLASRIPQANSNLPGSLLFLFNAMQQGTIPQWLGEAANRLQKAGKLDLINKLTQELQSATGVAHDPIVGEWHAYPIPFHDQNQFQLLHMYVHRDRDQSQHQTSDNATKGTTHTRFLINVNMTQLGPIQMDGLVQKRQMDMIIRNEHVLPATLPPTLLELYRTAMSGIGFAGTLNFQTGRQNWLNLQRDGTGAEVTT